MLCVCMCVCVCCMCICLSVHVYLCLCARTYSMWVHVCVHCVDACVHAPAAAKKLLLLLLLLLLFILFKIPIYFYSDHFLPIC